MRMQQDASGITSEEPEHYGSRRDPEERPVSTPVEVKERNLAKLADLPLGTWAALTLQDHEVVGTGPSRDAAVFSARKRGHNILNLVRVDAKSPLGLAS